MPSAIKVVLLFGDQRPRQATFRLAKGETEADGAAFILSTQHVTPAIQHKYGTMWTNGVGPLPLYLAHRDSFKDVKVVSSNMVLTLAPTTKDDVEQQKEQASFVRSLFVAYDEFQKQRSQDEEYRRLGKELELRNELLNRLPKRAKPWSIFCSDFHKSSTVENKGPDYLQAMNSQARSAWQAMSTEERKPYVQRAEARENEYQQAKMKLEKEFNIDLGKRTVCVKKRRATRKRVIHGKDGKDPDTAPRKKKKMAVA